MVNTIKLSLLHTYTLFPIISSKIGNKFSEPDIYSNYLIKSVENVGTISSAGRYSGAVNILFCRV